MAFNCTLSLINNQKVTYTAINRTQFEAEIVLDDLSRRLVERLSALAGMDRCERVDLELLGQLLYRVLLPVGDGGPNQDLRKQLESDYAFFVENRKGNDRFRVTLELHQKASELARFPWEFLFMPTPEGGFFLAGEKTDLILTRFVPNQPPETNVKTEEPLRILVVFSHPSELGDIKSRVTNEVINDIRELATLGKIEVRVEDNPTHAKLRELMNGRDIPGDDEKPPEERERFRPDIFHFIGHGEPNKLALIRDEKSIKAIEDETGVREEAAWCETGEVLRLFSNHTPRLVFLHACDTAKPKSVESLSDLARDLVYAKIPVVIAMQYTIKNKDAALFAKTFYQEIRNNSEIDEAVRAGREALGQQEGNRESWSDRRFGTPVVYLQKNSQRAIVNFPKRPGQNSQYDSNVNVDCPNPKCPQKVELNWTICPVCRHEIMMCPNCLKRNGARILIDREKGCNCGYSPEPLVVGAASTVGAASAKPEQPSPTPPDTQPTIKVPSWGQAVQPTTKSPWDLTGT